jgi:uncharacterized membrane protein YfcA
MRPHLQPDDAKKTKQARPNTVMSAKTSLLAVFAGLTVFFCLIWMSALRGRRAAAPAPSAATRIRPSVAEIAVGFITDFLDTLGIGSFATTTTIYKVGHMVPDEVIPGTMNVGHTLPTILEAFIYISFVKVEFATLVVLLAAAVLGAWAGAGIVARLPRRAIQLGIGLALLGSLALMVMGQLRLFPVGGDGLKLRDFSLLIGVAGNFFIGAVSTLGIGFYAPCMILISLLRMNPLAAYPIMMGSAACLMPVASARFLRANAYLEPAAVGLTVGGLPAVLMAAFLVRSLPLIAVRWLVMAVVLWAAILLLKSAAARGNGTDDSRTARALAQH